MAIVWIRAGEAAAARRRVYFDCRDAATGLVPQTGEAGGQPELSIDGAAWTSDGIGTLAAIGHGRYHAELAPSAVAAAGARIETRYKSPAVAECRGDAAQIVGFDPYDGTRLGLAALPAADFGDPFGIAAAGEDVRDLDTFKAYLLFLGSLHEGAIEAATDSTVVLGAAASPVDDYYVGAGVKVFFGAGAGQNPPAIVAYDGPTRTATLDRPWKVVPEAGALCILTSQTPSTLAARTHAGAVLPGTTDPLSSLVPGDYPSGTAGHAIGRLSSARVAAVSPVAADGSTITLVQGDDYHAGDGRALDFSSESWPDLASATVALRAQFIDLTFVQAASVLAPSGPVKTVRVELDAAATSSMPASSVTPYAIEAVLASGRRATLARGRLVVLSHP